MTTHTIRHPPASGLARLAALLHDLAHASLSLTRACDRWLAHRQRAARDSAELRAMSDRELADIGVPRASVDPASRGLWRRDPLR